MDQLRVGFALCGSFCTLSKALIQMRELKALGADIFPIMSENAYSTDTRFGKAADIVAEIEDICGRPVIHTIRDAEPIGPKRMIDILIIEPCTGNTLAKLANGITDTPVTLAAKAHIRNGGAVLIAVSTNDALGAAAANIGRLLNTKHIFFVPMRQDDHIKKPNSIVADFSKTYDAAVTALSGVQPEPLLLAPSGSSLSRYFLWIF